MGICPAGAVPSFAAYFPAVGPVIVAGFTPAAFIAAAFAPKQPAQFTAEKHHCDTPMCGGCPV